MSDAIQQTDPKSFDNSRSFAGWLRQKTGKIDRVFLTAAGVAVLWLLLDSDAAQLGVVAAGKSLLGIAPFIILSVLLAAYLKATGADGLIAKAFAGNIVQATFLAAIVGALSWWLLSEPPAQLSPYMRRKAQLEQNAWTF